MFLTQTYSESVSRAHESTFLSILFWKFCGEAGFLPCENYRFLFKLNLAFLELIICFPLAAAKLLWTLLCLPSLVTYSVGDLSGNVGLRLHPNAGLTIRRILHFNKTLNTFLAAWGRKQDSGKLWEVCGILRESKWEHSTDSVAQDMVKSLCNWFVKIGIY